MTTIETTRAPSKVQTARRTLFRRPDVRIGAAIRLWQRSATIYKRTYKLNLLPNFFEPFFYLLAMGLGLGAYLTELRGVEYIDYIAPGLAASAAMFGAEFEVTYNAFVKMNFGKVYDAIGTTPLTPEDIALGEMLWATTRATLYGTFFLIVASGFGVVHSWGIALAPLALALIGMHFAVLGLTYTILIPIIDYFSYFWTMVVTPMFLFSGIFFPLDRLPEWAQTLAWFVPLHQAVNLMRALVLTGDMGAAAAAAAWLLSGTIVLFVVPLNLMRWKLVK